MLLLHDEAYGRETTDVAGRNRELLKDRVLTQDIKTGLRGLNRIPLCWRTAVVCVHLV
jgi:hypothetical protein